METYQSSGFADSLNANLEQDLGHPALQSAPNEMGSTLSTFYDEASAESADSADNSYDLGGLHYMNYLHSHDDML
jgi:hypothetical protein